MNKLFLFGAAFIALSFTHPTMTTNTVKPLESTFVPVQNDKAFLLDYYRKTENRLKEQLKGLSDAQLQFKPSADKWSISQCVEHIIKTENMLFGMAKETLAKPANPERKTEVKVTDQQLMDGITDRSHKAEAPAALIGEGAYTDVKTAMADFRAQRKAIRSYLKDVSVDDLRNHVSDSPFGPVDGYHSMLFIAGHTARHTLQIEEVKANPAFPK
ncbi:DinB family protein [Parapedobacter sp. 10938]|uniref:DinB family protein n=1 Tax=Parapedobacter flavus TaxID=3110225 RepID=UPI002DBBE09F|nr:DinB family protein [Parapedobacter sp. 10938]MEC3878900.1 DinB family protein [Parapedobacter sp. 10938]